MLFNSYIFLFVFLPVCYGVFWSLPSARARHVWLALSGYIFYGYWDPRFTLLMAFSTFVSFSAGLGFLRWSDRRARTICLVLPITIDLCLLGFFKYANFGLETTRQLLQLFGTDVRVPHLNIILPIGISFYTFHTISYIVDSYRGVVTPTRNFFEFASYVSLFSQLVAGPIVRFKQIEGDLENIGQSDRTRWLGRGVSFLCIGMVEKILIADSIAGFVDPALAHVDALSTLGAWLAMFGYSFQLYFDFSGYSSMAVGLGYLFGLRIPQNFNSPYKALDPSDFWRRWHISLSSCLRDYLYIPFGGNRGGEARTYRNLMLTMLIGGLWHGASWVFVAWGAYHGLLLGLYRRFGFRWDRMPVAVRQLSMFVAAVIGWVFFRSTDFGMAARLLATMVIPTRGSSIDQIYLAVPLLGAAAWWAMIGPNPFEMRHEIGWRRGFALTAAAAACLALIAGTRTAPFLYFQF
ncbi:MAG: MBOAT family O-acyltransferase [Gemmatimonadaceae bacterium]